MFSRRGFIRLGAASVGSLALRPFGLLPALAQSGPDYRALVCVFLYGGNDSNNTIIPMNSYSAYQSIRGSLGLATGALTQVTAVNGAPYGFHTLLAELASMFTAGGAGCGGERWFAGCAAHASAISGVARADSIESFLPRRSAAAVGHIHGSRQ